MNNPLPIRLVVERQDARSLCEELFAVSDAGLPVSIDTESYNHDKDRHDKDNGLVLSAQFSWDTAQGPTRIVVITANNYGDNLEELAPWLAARSPKLGHDLVHESHMLANHGLVLAGPFWDMMIADFLLDQTREGQHGLKECAADHLGRKRLTFPQTFGSPRLRKDHQPYASGALDVPFLDAYLELSAYSPPSSYEEIVQYGGQEYINWLPAWENFIKFKRGNIPPKLSYWGKWYNFCDYAAADPWDDLSLYHIFRPKLEKLKWGEATYWDFFSTCKAAEEEELVYPIERRGMLLDLPFLAEMREKCIKDMEELEYKAVEWAGCPMEIGKDRQLTMLLHGDGMQPVYKGQSKYKGGPKSKVDFYIPGRGIPVPDENWTDGGEKGEPQPSMKAECLQRLQDWAETEGRNDLGGLKFIVDYSKADKQKGTYLEGMANLALPVHGVRFGRLHTRIGMTTATSHRWSSSGPNLQNITTGKKDKYNLRDCFIADEGDILVVGDSGNLEYRLLTLFSRDPLLWKMFMEGYDMHSLTAYNVFDAVKKAVDVKFGGYSHAAGEWIKEEFKDIRDKFAKVMNFEIIYGVGPRKLGQQLKIPKNEAWDRIQGWYRTYAGVRPWQERLLAGCRRTGHIKLIDGCYRFADMNRLNAQDRKVRSQEERTLANAAIQGSAARLIVNAMLRISRDKELAKMGYRIIMQIHDEIVGSVPMQYREEACVIVKNHMENAFGRPLDLPFPASVHWAPSWACAK